MMNQSTWRTTETTNEWILQFDRESNNKHDLIKKLLTEEDIHINDIFNNSNEEIKICCLLMTPKGIGRLIKK